MDPAKQPLLRPGESSSFGSGVSADCSESSGHVVHVYKRRWYILLVYSYFCLSQALVWNSWPPISGPAEAAFNWTDSHITTMNNLGCLGALFASLFYSWFIVKKGFRNAMLSNGAALCLGSGIRCVSSDAWVMTCSAMIGALLNGGASLAGAGAAVTSSIWFPVRERFTATSIGLSSWYLGSAVSFLIGPAIVDDPFLNQTTYNSSDMETAKSQIMNLLYIEAGMSAFLMLLLIIYFPAKPPRPPSFSAIELRYEFGQAVKSLATNAPYWRVLLAFVLTMGVYSSWSPIIDVNMKSINIDQQTAGWMGFLGVVATVTGSFSSARINDYFKKQVKTSILVLLFVASCMFLWFALMVQMIVEPTIPMIYVSVIIAAVSTGGCLPLFFELLCENAYPTPEAIASGCMGAASNTWSVMFYLLFLVPGIGTAWMNWMQFGVVLPTFVLIATFRPTYARLMTDANDDAARKVDKTSPPHPSHMMGGTPVKRGEEISREEERNKESRSLSVQRKEERLNEP